MPASGYQPRRARAVVLAVAAVLALPAASPSSAAPLPESGAASVVAALPAVSHLRATPVRVAGGFVQPVAVVSAPEGLDRLYVVERRGTVKRWQSGASARLYVDLRTFVRSSGAEQGLLGLAFDPRFGTTHRLYVAYTRGDGALVVARLRASSTTAGSVSAATRVTVLVVPHPTYSNHNGGDLAFGPDGYLYIGTGDGGGAGDPFAHAGSLSSLSGKILRIDVSRTCGTRQYCIPASNPWRTTKGARPEVVERGLRNPWRFGFDAATGDLWIGDVGQDRYEEVDHLAKGAVGRDLGWSCWEGRVHYTTSRCRAGATYTFPVAVVTHPSAEALVGGFVYRGRAYASLAAGTYVFGDEVTSRVWAYRGGALAQISSLSNVTSFGESDAHELYAVGYGGGLYRLAFRAV